jgi:hypothetical protein
MRASIPILLIATLVRAAMCQASEAEQFEKLSKQRDPAAAVALAQAGDAGIPFLIQGLQGGGRVSALAAWALSEHPHPDAAAALRETLLKPDQVTGYFAARTLGKMPSPENAAALASLLGDETNGFWELASGGVGRLRDAWDAQGRRYHEPAPANLANIRVAYAAMESLGEIGGGLAANTLERALTNDQYLIRYGAARGLGRMRHAAAAEKLASMAESDAVLLVRQAAKQALAVLRGTAPPEMILRASPIWAPEKTVASSPPVLPSSIAFVKTRNRSDATFGFRDSYFFPKTPRFHSGENLYTLTPPRPDGELINLTQLSHGEVQGPEISYDGTKLLFAMRRDKDRDGFHIYEINVDGSGLRQLTDGNCNDADPFYLPDGRIVFCSDRAGYQEFYHQERSRVIYIMNGDGTNIQQITFNPNQDYEPIVLRDGRLLYSSYRFYAQDGSEGPLRGERMGLARIETVLRVCQPNGSGDDLFYGAMRGAFYSPMRPMPFGDQFAGWHGRGFHVGVSVSHQREMPDGRIISTTPAGLTLLDSDRAPVDCELPIYPEVINLAGGEEVYIHNYDDKNPVGRYTTPYPAGGDWIWVSHAPWHNLRETGYGIYLMNIVTRELVPVYQDRDLSVVDPVPIAPQPMPLARSSALADRPSNTGLVLCNSVFNTDQPFDTAAVRYVRVLEAIQMGQSINANAAFRTRLLGTAPIHPDGSFFLEVPADVPIRFELLDQDGRMLIHETEFNTVRRGETKGCIGCHENRKEVTPNLRPMALDHPPFPAVRQRGDLIYFGHRERPYNRVYRD